MRDVGTGSNAKPRVAPASRSHEGDSVATGRGGLVGAGAIRQGATVAAGPAKAVEELYEIRGLIEGEAAKVFALRASDSEMLDLRQAFEKLERCQYAGDLLEAESHIYRVILTGAGSETMNAVLEWLTRRSDALGVAIVTSADRPAQGVRELEAIVAAIERRDAHAAAAAASFHAARSGEILTRRKRVAR